MLPVSEPRFNERSPLLEIDRPVAFHRQCLEVTSARCLTVALLVTFLFHLIYTGRASGWINDLVVMLVADVFYTLGAIGSIVISVMCLLQCTHCAPRCTCFLLAAVIQAFAAWMCMVKICEWHQFPGTGEEAACLFKGPVAIGHMLWGCLWRPWWMWGYVLPLAVLGKGPASTLPWTVWREILIGTVFWFCAMTYVPVINYIIDMADTRRGTIAHIFFAFYTFTLTYQAFLLTSTPATAFISFLAGTLRKFSTIFWGDVPQMRIDEWIVTSILAWFVMRFFCMHMNWKLDQLQTRWKMEEALRHAMDHPFVAQLEQDFGAARAEGNGGSSAIMRTLSRSLAGRSSSQLERLCGPDGLKEKQQALLDARRQTLWELPRTFDVTVNRESIVKDSMRALFSAPARKLCAHRLRVSYVGERAVDAGGVARDWFDSVAMALVRGAENVRGDSLLTLAPDQTLFPRPVEGDDEERFRMFLSLGKFLALTVLHQQPVPLSFNVAVCKYFLQVPVGMNDVRALDPDFYRLRIEQVLQDQGVKEMESMCGEPLTFMSAATEFLPSKELCEGGATKLVTEENKTEYVRMLCEEYVCGGFRREIKCMLQGFYDVLPLEFLQLLAITPRELSMMISGIQDVDVRDWRLHSASGSTEVHRWFWEVVAEFTSEQRCMLLHFATGSSRLPPGGFADLRPQFSICVTDSGTPEHLPHAHTCANQIVLHNYPTKEIFYDKLLQSIEAKGFSFI